MTKFLSNNLTQAPALLLLIFSCVGNAETAHKKILWGQNYNIVTSIGKISSYEFEDEEKSIYIRKYTKQENETAKSFISNKLALFNSVYEPKRVDYPGQYSKFIECPDEFKPKYKEDFDKNSATQYMVSFANSNKAPGACSQDLIGYKHLYGFKYCKNEKAVYEVEIFSTTNSIYINDFMEKASCK